MLWRLAIVSVILYADAGPTGACSSDFLENDMVDELISAADNSKAGSCLLQARSASAARRWGVVEEVAKVEDEASDGAEIGVASGVIPKIVHHMYKDDISQGPWPNPVWEQSFVAWKTLFPEPEFLHMFWSDAKALSFVEKRCPKYLKAFAHEKREIVRSDFSRYCILWRLGGIYADLDYQPLSQFYEDLKPGRVNLVQSPYVSETYQNSLMASPPDHVFWQKIMDLGQFTMNAKNILLAAGPQLLETLPMTHDHNMVHGLSCNSFQRPTHTWDSDEADASIRKHCNPLRAEDMSDKSLKGIHWGTVSYTMTGKSLEGKVHMFTGFLELFTAAGDESDRREHRREGLLQEGSGPSAHKEDAEDPETNKDCFDNVYTKEYCCHQTYTSAGGKVDPSCFDATYTYTRCCQEQGVEDDPSTPSWGTGRRRTRRRAPAIWNSGRSNLSSYLETPLPDSYWANVSEILAIAAATTPRPNVTGINGTNTALALRPGLAQAQWIQSLFYMFTASLQPLNTRLGAQFLYDVTVDERYVATKTPPPTQAYISSQLQSACPLLLFRNQLEVYPPKCGQRLGSWADPISNHTVVRWEKLNWDPHLDPENGYNGRGMRFGVDNVSDTNMSGDAAVTFATIHPQLTFSGYRFDFFNCVNMGRYVIDEQVIKVDKMGQYSRTRPHEARNDHEEYLFKYSVLGPNNTVVMESSLFRMFDDEINFTTVTGGKDQPQYISTVAIARRKGKWQGREWHSCLVKARGWHLEFPQPDMIFRNISLALSDEDQLGSVLDFRVIASAVITLMAARDEDRSIKTGLTEDESGGVFLSWVGSLVVMLHVVVIACCLWVVCAYSGAQRKVRKALFQIEECLPKGAMSVRPPPVTPVW
jgi:hypothetical protein